MPYEDDFYGEGMTDLPPEIARIVNKKEGREAYDIKEPCQNAQSNILEYIRQSEINNTKYNNYLKEAQNLIKNRDFNYKPLIKINENPDYSDKKEKYYYPISKNYNLHRYIYGRLYASVYRTHNAECFITEASSRIYSWISFLRSYEKNNNIYYFRIRNIDEQHSTLAYAFNKNNIIDMYSDYLDAIAYCIDNNY